MSDRQIQELKNVDINSINRDELVDITQIEIRNDIPVEERIQDFICKVKNPYCFKVGEFVVKTSFAENSSVTMSDCIKSLLTM